MRTICVLFGMLLFCFKSVAEFACDDPLLKIKEFEIIEKQGENGEFHFSNAQIEIKASCEGPQRSVLITNGVPFEMIPEYFADGKVRQYVVKACGREFALIKIDRPSFRRDSEFTQPRLSLTDQFDRIIGEIANGENDEKEFTVRDTESRIIASGTLKGNAKWEVSSSTLDPLLSALLLCAARMERNSCENVVEYREYVRGVAIGTGIALVLGTAYFLPVPTWCRNYLMKID